MRALAADKLEWSGYPGQRGTGLEYKPLFNGKEKAPDNYELRLVRFREDADYYAPRHRHNFDQFRWPLAGALNYAPRLDIQPGQLGYFPEGAYYGPQEIQPGCEFLIVQFAGANGDGYMGVDETNRGVEALKERGEFNRGVYRYTDADGRAHNKDGYEAVWEQVNGRPIKYASPRYTTPIIIDPAGFSWRPDAGNAQASWKPLGTFSERRIQCGLLHLTGGTVDLTTASQVLLGFAVDGAATIDGSDYGPHAALELTAGETATIGTDGELTLLYMTMPDFSTP